MGVRCESLLAIEQGWTVSWVNRPVSAQYRLSVSW